MSVAGTGAGAAGTTGAVGGGYCAAGAVIEGTVEVITIGPTDDLIFLNCFFAAATLE